MTHDTKGHPMPTEPSPLPEVLSAYIDCALWSSTDFRSEDDPGEPFDSWATTDDLDPQTLESFRADCQAFLTDEYTSEVQSLWSPHQFGHDFWLTRNGHGAGFWDRYSGSHPGEAIGRHLTDAAHVYGEVNLYTGDDGKVYAS